MAAKLRSSTPSTTLVHVRVTPEERHAYAKAAKVNGMTLSEWARTAMRAAL